MSELLTMQDLANGHLDVKALGEAANGDENTIVTTRTGNTYPSAERAINIMFQNGGLPAIPFKTKALMTASSLSNDKYAMVTDDAANNGLYVKTAGTWVKSGYDPAALAQPYTDARVAIAEDKTEDLRGLVFKKSYNLYNPLKATIGAKLKADGTADTTQTLWSTSDYTQVVGGKQYTASAAADSNGFESIAYYTSKKVFISKEAVATKVAEDNRVVITTPTDAFYVRLDMQTVKPNEGARMLAIGSDVRGYQPYFSDPEISAPLANRIKELTKDGEYISGDAEKDLVTWTDSEYNVIARIDSNSSLLLTGLDKSVQDSIRDVKGASDSISIAGGFKNYLHVFADNDRQVVGGIREDGGLMVTGSTVSLQEEVGIRPVEPLKIIDPKTMFSDACTPYFLNMSISGVKNAPVPYGLLPQKYTVPNTIINAFELTPPDPYSYIPIDTPYNKNDRVVHPYVIEFRGGFRGYRYLMCINPYTVEYHENPTIYGSSSLDGKWELLTGTRQPLEEPKDSRYFSDSGFSYDPINGMLICYWRDGSSAASGVDQIVKYRATRDGIQWTETKVLFSLTEGTGHVSPSMLFNPNDGLWHFWSGTHLSFSHYTAKNLNDSWVLVGTGSVSEMWHSEVRFVGNKYLMLANKRDPNSNYKLAISDDGTTWTQGKALFSTPPNALYKASYIANITGNTLSLDIVYTTNHAAIPELMRRFYHVKTNTINIGE